MISFIELRCFLREFGPLLLSSFRVTQDLLDQARAAQEASNLGTEPPLSVRLSGECSLNEGESLHAMLVVGVRSDGPKDVILAQNWWKGAEFIEIEIDYCADNGASLWAVNPDFKDLPTGTPVIDGAFSHVACYAWDSPDDGQF